MEKAGLPVDLILSKLAEELHSFDFWRGIKDGSNIISYGLFQLFSHFCQGISGDMDLAALDFGFWKFFLNYRLKSR